MTMDEKVDLEASLPLPTTANQSIGIKDTIASEAITTSKQTSSVKWDKLIRVAGISILVWLAYNSLIPTSESLKHDKTSEIDPYFAGLKAKEFEFASVSPFTTGVSGNGDDDTLAVRYGSGRQGGKTLNVNQEQDEEEGSDSDSDGDDDTEDTNRDEKNIKGKHDKHGKHGKHGKHDKHGHRHPHQRVPPKKAEEIFLSVPSNDSVAAASYRYTKNEHMAGTGNGHLSAINLKAEYEAHLGLPFSAPYENVFDAGTPENQHAVLSLADTDREAQPKVWVDTYFPVMNKPVFRSVDILVPDGNGLVEWSAKLREDIVEGDPTSIYRDEVPTFHGLSVSGNVTGPILYAGYGSKQDFEALEAAGIDVTGSIILVKYGKVFRGLKIKAAQEAGAIGCLIYSDPGDDGEITLKNGYEAYPAGPARQPSSVQRGSVQFISSYPGDPTTEGYPSYENATRTPPTNQPSIPSLPISYQDALPLLQSLVGHGKLASEVGKDWVGGLDITYHVGPSQKQIKFINEVDTKVTPINNVFAFIPGTIRDEIVVIGNHRDAWVLGGSDPSSGTATVNEIMKGLSVLRKKGWKPLRSILVASWDAEEYGLIGSTEWVEDFQSFIRGNVVSYLNLDVSVSGNNFHGSASPSLALLLKAAAEQIDHPTDNTRSLWSMKDGGDWNEYHAAQGLVVNENVEGLYPPSSGVSPLGSGSDYTGFLAFLGVASTDMGYKGGPKDPPYHYHSIYDSHTWLAKYGDPYFKKHTAAAQILGLITLRLVDSAVLPFNLTQYAVDLGGYLDKVEHIADSMDVPDNFNFSALGKAIQEVHSAAVSLHEEADDALKRLHKLLPRPSSHHPRLSFLSRAAWRLRKAFGLARGQCSAGPDQRTLEKIKNVLKEIRKINGKLSGFESGFISKEGIKDRTWYKHKGTAPGKWLGYGASTFPAVTEALTVDKDFKLAQKETDELVEMISEMAKRLRE